jgi:BirA family biotin operon repressor/biotin-[acetyl-CoA-carboxylase] ligase
VPLLAGVAVVEIVKELGVTGASLKWPNDVLVEGRKLAGILVEVLPDSRMVVGVGVNIASTLDSLPHPTATSLALQGIELTNIEQELLAPIAQRLDSYLQLANGNTAEYAHSEWKKGVTHHLSTLGRAVRWEATDGEEKRGIAKDLADDGGLVVREVSGLEDCVIRSGDVFHIERS